MTALTPRETRLSAYTARPRFPKPFKMGCCTGSVAHGWAPIGAMQFHLICLRPGEEQELLFGLGYIENPENEKFSAPGVINKTRAHAQ